MSEQAQQAGSDAAAQQPVFQIVKLYVRDLSLEVPNAPQVFMQEQSPQLEIQLRNEAMPLNDGLFDVSVTATVTAKTGEKTIFLAEVAQCGVFQVTGFPQEELERVLQIACPTVLYPYAREAIADLVGRGGFPSVMLQPVSFEQMYLQRRAQADAGGQPRIEIAQ
jgi:preprotein translocase subunit SecB